MAVMAGGTGGGWGEGAGPGEQTREVSSLGEQGPYPHAAWRSGKDGEDGQLATSVTIVAR